MTNKKFKAQAAPSVWPSFHQAESILARLSGFPRYPDEKGREVFVETLMRAVSPEHARAALTLFDEEFPTLRQLKDAVSRTQTEFRRHNPNPECKRCGGTGFAVAENGNTSSAQKCSCFGDFPIPEIPPITVFDGGPETIKAKIRSAAAKKQIQSPGRKASIGSGLFGEAYAPETDGDG